MLVFKRAQAENEIKFEKDREDDEALYYQAKKEAEKMLAEADEQMDKQEKVLPSRNHNFRNVTRYD